MRTPVAPSRICAAAREAGLLAGIPLDTHPLRPLLAVDRAPLDRMLLVAVTEKRTRDEIDRLVEVLARFAGSGDGLGDNADGRREAAGAPAESKRVTPKRVTAN